MIGSYTAELFKLRKRPATWILGAIAVLTIGLVGYALPYLTLTQLRTQMHGAADPTVQALQQSLLPAYVVSTVLSSLSGFGGAVALILGVLSVGSEFGWTTLRTILIQRPPRHTVLGGKVLALGTVLLVFVVLLFAAGCGASLSIAAADHAAVRWPPLLEIARGMGAGWLILAAWAAVGVGLAALVRGTAPAIGIGLIYWFVEGLIVGFAGQTAVVRTISTALLSTNIDALPRSFPTPLRGMGPAHAPVAAGQAALVLAAYIGACVLVATVLVRRRDVV